MANPVLVIMAAGMGSRYGGLKQIDPIGPNGQILLDYSIYDAHRAGFDRVVFIIRPELHEAFEDAIGKKARRFMQVDYAYQTLDNLPDGLTAPEGREKPLGTAHAVWCAKELTAGCPIAVINADDFYGADAFRKMYDYLASAQDDDKFRYCMVPAGEIAPGTPVSLNLWGFTPSFLPSLDDGLREFFAGKLPDNPMKAEYYLPFAVDALIKDGKATAKVLTTDSRWYGVTYREDKPTICAAVATMTENGDYPADL